MGLLSNRIAKTQLKAGDHIYTWRAMYTYSHHGIFVGRSMVIHFTREHEGNSSAGTTFDSFGSYSKLPSCCPFSPDCGSGQENCSVVLSCLECFLGNGPLYRFEYGVSPSFFLAKFRGGTCTTAKADPPKIVIHRAMYLLQNGFGEYDVFQNNCEDLALYCKTGLQILDQAGVGRSGQASSVIGGARALLSFAVRYFVPGPVGMVTATAGTYCVNRYATDIGVRTDVIKVAVEDMAVKMGWVGQPQEIIPDESDMGYDDMRYFNLKKHVLDSWERNMW